MTTATLNPSVDSELAKLLLTKGFTFQNVADSVPDCTFTLLCRIALARQPFPYDLAVQVQDLTGIDAPTLISTTKYWTLNTGHLERVALPPDVLRGDPVESNVSFPTQPMVQPAMLPAVPEVWVVGGGLGASSASGAQAINRNTGLVTAEVTFVDVVDPVEVVFDGTYLWTLGNGISAGVSWAGQVDPSTATVVSEQNGAVANYLGVCFESVNGMVWACPTSTISVKRFNPASGANPDASIALNILLDVYSPRDVVAVDGLLYVAAVHATGILGQPWEGRVFELDPVALGILRSSTGTDLGNAQGIAVDDAGNLWVTSRSGGGAIGPMVSKVPLSTFVAAQVPLIGDPGTLVDPNWIEFLFGNLWVSDAQAPNGRLFSMDAGGNVLQSRTFAGGSDVGHAVSDGKFLWYADKPAGLVHMLDPLDVSFSPFTVLTGGAPDGLIAIDR